MTTPEERNATTPPADAHHVSGEASEADGTWMVDEGSLAFEAPEDGSALGRTLKLMPRALSYLRPHRAKGVALLFVTVGSAVFTLAEPWPLAFVVDGVLRDKPPPKWIIAMVGKGTVGQVLLAVAASLVITLLAGGMTVLEEYLSTNIDLRMGLDFRSDLLRHVQSLSPTFHDDNRTGVLMFRINSQAGSVGSMVVSLPTVAHNLLTIVGMGYVAYRIDPHIAELALVVVPFIYKSTIYYTDRIEPQLLTVRAMEGMNLAIVHEALSMLRVIVAFGRERHQFDRFRRQGEATVDLRVKVTVRQTMFKLAVSFITAAGTATVLGVGAYQVLHRRVSVGELLVIMAYIASVYAPLESLTNHMTAFQQQMISFEHSLHILDTPIEVTEKPDAVSLGRAEGSVMFDHVGFGYKTRPGTLRDISFQVDAGRAVAIVGPTGAGKSTLVSLMPRFYDTSEGRVLIDGQDVRDLTIESVRKQFSIVLQEPLLFEGTIAENIRYGKPDATEDEIVSASMAANAHEFITHLPARYDTLLGERGAKISSGERQRISVARAFLRDAPILILDEPTSSIDSRTEEVILDALDRLMVGRTTIMIAHRLSTLRNVDEILVLHEGEIVQRGTPEELIRSEGLYRQLFETQAGERRAFAEAVGQGRAPSALEDHLAARSTSRRQEFAARRVARSVASSSAALGRLGHDAPHVDGGDDDGPTLPTEASADRRN